MTGQQADPAMVVEPCHEPWQQFSPPLQTEIAWSVWLRQLWSQCQAIHMYMLTCCASKALEVQNCMPHVHAHASPSTINMYVNGQHECLSLQHCRQCAPMELLFAGELLPAQLPLRGADLCASTSSH